MNGISNYINSHCDIHIIISKENEPERYDYLNSYFTKHKLKWNYYHVSYDLSTQKEYTRAKNYLELVNSCLKKTKPFVLIMESDCLFMPHFVDQLYNVCNKIMNSTQKSVIVNFSKFEHFATTCLLYTKPSLDNVNLILPPYSSNFSYYPFLEKFRKDIIVSKPYIILSGNIKIALSSSVMPGTKNTRYKKSFDVDPRFDRFFKIYPNDIPKKHKIPLVLENGGDNELESKNDQFKEFIQKTYFICNKEFEKEKYDYITRFTNEKFKNYNYKICCPTWGNTLTQEEISKFSGITKMTNPVMSIATNYIYIMKEIASMNPKDNDHFMIIESDSLFTKDFINVCNDLYGTLKNENFEYDYIDIGNGMGYFPTRFGYETSQEYAIYLANKMRCAGSIIYKYSCIRKILDYYEKTNDISYAIDELYDYLVTMNKLKIYWLNPPIVIQGSQNGSMKSTIQTGDVIWDALNYDLVSYKDENKSNKIEIEWEIDDMESIKLEMDEKMITDILSKSKSEIQVLNKHVSEIKFVPEYISLDRKITVNVNCSLFKDKIEIQL